MFQRGRKDCYNRTYVELKLSCSQEYLRRSEGYNRTYVELKQA